MNIYYIFILISIILSVVLKTIIKSIKLNILYIPFVSSLAVFIFISSVVYYNYKNNPKKFIVKKNKFKFGDNPFKNIFNKYSFLLGGISITCYYLYLIALKKLPLNFIIPFSMLWLLFAMGFNKLFRKRPITSHKIIGIIMILFGIFIMQFKILFSNFKLKISYLYPILLLIIVQILKGGYIIFNKEVIDVVSPNQIILLSSTTCLILATFVLLIYKINPMNFWKLEKVSFIKCVSLFIYSIILINIIKELKFISFNKVNVNTFNILSALQIIFAVIFGYFVFNEPITKYTIIGGIILIYGIYYSKDHHKKLVDKKTHVILHHNVHI